MSHVVGRQAFHPEAKSLRYKYFGCVEDTERNSHEWIEIRGKEQEELNTETWGPDPTGHSRPREQTLSFCQV